MSQNKSENFLNDKTIFLTGACGSIGSALSKKINEYNPKQLILFDQDETGIFNLENSIPKSTGILGNIRDTEKLEKVFKEFKPDLVIHAAAYKHIGLCERYPEEAYKNNIVGTGNVISISKKYGAKFILISTDKAVNPTSMMGASKKECEDMTLKQGGTVVRFGNVAASRGSVVPIFQEQIEKNEPITLTDKRMTRFFMGIYEAVDLIIKAIMLSRGGEIFILDMGEPIKIYDLAKLMIKLSGKDIPIIEVGIRKGEKLDEILMTDEEKKRAIKKNGLWIIQNSV